MRSASRAIRIARMRPTAAAINADAPIDGIEYVGRRTRGAGVGVVLFADPCTRTEAAAGAADADHPYAGVACGPFQGGGERGQHPRGERVQAVRTIEGDRQDAVGERDD